MRNFIFFILIFMIVFTQTCMGDTFFFDTNNHWAENDIYWAVNTLQVFEGYDDMSFRPNNNITRAEFITILSRTAVKLNLMDEVYKSSMNYSDMSINHWAYTYVISMYEHMNKYNKAYGFSSVFEGSKFYPEKPITREEAVALISVFATKSIFDNPINFRDVDENYKYYNEIKKLCNSEILTGYEDNTFRGSNKITRAESATLIKRVYDDIKYSDKNRYLSRIEFMPIKGEDMFSFFGNYNLDTKVAADKKYIKVKNTLEYASFGGYIFPEDEHLYDLNAIDTLMALRASGYYNVAGVNFYLMSFGNFDNAMKDTLANEILMNLIVRKDIKDSEFMQLFVQVSKQNVKEGYYMKALQNWDSITKDNNAKANILFYKYAYYVKNNNKAMLKSMIYDDLKKGNKIENILKINWNLKAGAEATDFTNYGFTNYSYGMFRNTTLAQYMQNPTIPIGKNTNVIELPYAVLVQKNEKVQTIPKAYESIFYKYSLNRAYILNFLGQRERGFVEALNDNEIMKTTSFYKTNKADINNHYKGILKRLK